MAENIIPDDMRSALQQTFLKELKNDVLIEVFTKQGMHDEFNDITKSFLEALGKLSDKLKITFHVVGDEKSIASNVARSPTVLIAPDKYRLRYTGAPLGEETRSFLAGILFASRGSAMLSEQAARALQEQLHEPRAIQVFVSPTCPYCPQQVLLAFSAAIVRPDLISAEVVEIYENQDLAENLGSLAVPQTFINNTFTGVGLQPEPLFIESLLSLKEPVIASTRISDEPIHKDIIVIGGGPAGLTAAIYAVRAGLSTVVIEKSNLGGQVAITPVIENYPGFMRIGGKSLVDLISQQAAQYAEIHIGEFVTEGDRKEDGTIHIKTNHAMYITKALLLATGVGNRALEAAGSQRFYGRGISYCATCDGYFYKDKKPVVVVGGGNTAVTDALYLKNLGAEVTLIHRGETLRSEVQLQETLKQNGIPVLWNSMVREIKGDTIVRSITIENLKAGSKSEMTVNGVFVAIGYVPNSEIAVQLGIELDEQGYIKTDLQTMRTSKPGIYACGDITGASKQIAVAVAQGSIAAMTAFEDISRRISTTGGTKPEEILKTG
ncbi:MAG: FAD-dependent oxidoreductase [Nitrospirota bacterium]